MTCTKGSGGEASESAMLGNTIAILEGGLGPESGRAMSELIEAW